MLSKPLILASFPCGLAVGALAWALAGADGARTEDLAAMQGRAAALASGTRIVASNGGYGAAQLLLTPLFGSVPTQGLPDPSLVLEGVSITARRLAALVSVNGAPAAWMTLGESRDGVTLSEVTAARAAFETASGVKVLALGERSGATPIVADQTPPGVRTPPPPASAPGVRP